MSQQAIVRQVGIGPGTIVSGKVEHGTFWAKAWQLLAAKDGELREKQREIDRLYGKLAAASPLTDAEMRSAFASALKRLAQHEMDTAEERAMRRTP